MRKIRPKIEPMAEQLLLFEQPPSEPPAYNPVLAVFPDHYTAEQINGLGESLREKHRLRRDMRPTRVLHVSLPLPRDIMRVPEVVAAEIISRVCSAVAAVMRPFEIKFDRVMSFRGRTGNHPLVLLNDNHGRDGIMPLQQTLSAEFAKYRSATRKSVPHLTLLYDEKKLSSQEVEPVCWTVKEIAVVHSAVGEGRYYPRGRWVLGE